MEPEPFRLFSFGHLFALACVIAAWVGVAWLARRLKTERQKKRVAIALAVMFLGLEVVATVHKQMRAGFDPTLSLPFHLCDLAFLAMFAALLTRKPFLYEFAYFFGFGGALFALLTPNLQDPLCDLFSIRFFISHAGVCASMIYLTLAFSLRPKARSVLRMFLAGNVYMVLAGAFNGLAGTNFGYLCHKPPGPTLLDYLGPWPYYLLWYEAIALIILPLLYLPFYLQERLRGGGQ